MSRLLRPFLLFCALSLTASSQAANQIALVGNVLKKCTLEANAESIASNLPLATSGTQHVLIATIEQDCNGRTGYTLDVFSTNCASAPVGAKVIDPVSGEHLSYSVESHNPTTGGSSLIVIDLLATDCTDQVARDVTHAIIHNQVSTFYINYTGSTALGAGVYQDTITVTMTAK